MFHYLDEAEDISDKDRQYMSLGIRNIHAQATETLFALMSATLQAPDCVYGWLFKYRIHQLNSIVTKIRNGDFLRNKFRLPNITWSVISNLIHTFTLEDKERETAIKHQYADFWSRLSSEFISSEHTSIYNSIKHRYRARPGGMFLSIGKEKIPGQPANPEDMQTLGGSKYGASYYYIDPKTSDSKNFRLRIRTTNWSPKGIWIQIALIRFSISNLISFLRIQHGHDPKDSPFIWPENIDDFTEDLKTTPGTLNASFDIVISDRQIQKLTKKELIALYDEHFSPKSAS